MRRAGASALPLLVDEFQRGIESPRFTQDRGNFVELCMPGNCGRTRKNKLHDARIRTGRSIQKKYKIKFYFKSMHL